VKDARHWMAVPFAGMTMMLTMMMMMVMMM
jgi:hypothetical protein